MEDQFTESLSNILRQTGFPNVDKIDFNFYNNKDARSLSRWISSEDLLENCLTLSHIKMVKDLKTEDQFLEEDEVDKAMEKFYGDDIQPAITKLDVECLESQMFELQNQHSVLVKLKTHMRNDLDLAKERLAKTKENLKKSKTLMDDVLTRCFKLDNDFNSTLCAILKEYSSYKEHLKDIGPNKNIIKDYLFQTSLVKYDVSCSVFNTNLTKLKRRIYQTHHSNISNRSTMSQDMSFEQSLRLFKLFSSGDCSVEEDFEKSRANLRRLSTSLYETYYSKVISTVEEHGFLAVLDALNNMNNDLDKGTIDFETIREDMEDLLYEENENGIPVETVEPIELACRLWMESQITLYMTGNMQARAVRRKVQCDRLKALCDIIQIRMIADDSIWIYLTTEKMLISRCMLIFHSVSNKLKCEMEAFKKRMVQMNNLVMQNVDSQSQEISSSAHNLQCIQKMILPKQKSVDINKIIDAIDKSTENVDNTGSTLKNIFSKINKSLSERDKKQSALNAFLFSGPARTSVVGGQLFGNQFNDVNGKMNKIHDSIQREYQFLDHRLEYFQRGPFKKAIYFLWAIYLTEKDKVQELIGNLEKEVKRVTKH